MKFYKTMRLTLIVVLTLGFMIPLHVHAQAGRGRGRLKGIVINEEGKHMVNARVEIVWHKDKKVKREGRTNEKGRFVFSSLGSGNWQIFVEADGYAPAQHIAEVMQMTNNPVVKIVVKKKVDLKEVARKQVKDDASLVDRANQLFAEARYDEAQELFEKFLEKQPDFYQTHLFIGNCHKEKSFPGVNQRAG